MTCYWARLALMCCLVDRETMFLGERTDRRAGLQKYTTLISC